MLNKDDKLNTLNPKDLTFFGNIPLTSDSFSYHSLDNTFTVFESVDKILYIIYSNIKNSIIFYDLIDNKKKSTIKNAHKTYITNLRHYLDKMNNINLLISLSSMDNNIKVWNINKIECLLNLENVNNTGELYSACLLFNNNNQYIITSNFKLNSFYIYIKIFDFKGNKISEIDNGRCFFIDTYYDKHYSKNYIISCNKGNVKSFDFNEKLLYQIYSYNHLNIEDDYNCDYKSAIIKEEKNIKKLISSNNVGSIVIWDFHSGSHLQTIEVGRGLYNLLGLCLWEDNNYIFVGCSDRAIKLIDLKKGRVIKNFFNHMNEILTNKKINHPKFGKCLISKSKKKEPLKIWSISNILEKNN